MNIAISTGLDILVVVTLAICLIIGYNKGLIRSVIGFFGKIASLVAAFYLSENLGVYINKNYIHAPLRQWLINQLSPTAENVNASLSSLDLDSLFAEKPAFFTDILNLLGADINEYSQTYETIKLDGIEKAKAAVTDLMITPVSEMLSRIIAFIAIFLVCSIGVAVLWWLSDLIINLPIIKQADKIGGIVFGALNGVLIVFIITAILGVSSQYILRNKTEEERYNIVKSTFIYKNIKRVNLIEDLLNGS